jgi:hypothetical protein
VNDIIVRPPIRDGRIIRRGTFHSVRTSSSGKKSIHQGLDFSPEIPGVPGQQIEPAIDGKIVFREWTPGSAFGRQIVVETSLGNGKYLYTSYNHLQSFAQEEDGMAIGGRPLGTLGGSGASAAGDSILPHLHFETIVADGKLDFSNGWPLGKGGSGTAGNGIKWERISPQFEIGGMIVTSTPDSVRATLRLPWATPAPPADSSPSFDDRYSAVYSPATMPIGDGKGIGRLPDIAATYDRDAGVGTSPPVRAPNLVGPSIPFVSRPNGSLVAPEGSSLLDPTPTDPGTPGPFSTGGRFVPRASPPQPLYPTGPLVPASSARMQDRQGSLDDRSGNWSSSPAEDAGRFRSPVLRELQRYRQLAASGVAAAPSSAASNLGAPRSSIGVDSETGDVMGGVFKWIENGLIPSAEASPSKSLPQGVTAPDIPGDSDGSISGASEAASPLAKDNRRYLSRPVVGQGSAFDTGAPAVPFVPSNAGLAPDYPNSFENPFGSKISTEGATQPAQPHQAATPLGLFTGQPMPNRVVPLPILDILDRSTGREGSADERESHGTRIPMLDEYIRYLNREYPS